MLPLKLNPDDVISTALVISISIVTLLMSLNLINKKLIKIFVSNNCIPVSNIVII